MENLDPNEIFTLAADIIRNTSQSVFLTGKAGTGKTTFLHYIRANVDKNIIVAAPTGVAAINAGGVTLHSLLQLPFEPYIPNMEGRKKLDYHFKLRKSKIEMLRELDLLIIDEVSMLRADMVDAMDQMLRRYRTPSEPFGGVQMLFIGDMFQLPPVVQAQEWEKLKPYYPSPFFFHAQALHDNMPLYVELKTIYRQSDQQFIDILNRIRNSCTTSLDLEILNKRYDPNFRLKEGDGYVVLCTHNYKADKINSEELARLDGKAYTFGGQIRGDFGENSLPAELKLTLKVGVQVMFVRNDAGENRRFYNGKLATISHITDEQILVRFEDGSELELDRETWRNVRYTLNSDSGNIEEEEMGTFTQYPIRLAWAITIHKSQGLTFERVAIDAGQAFAGGQVYVALSRCTTLEGIVLFSRITSSSIQTDKDAIAFTRHEKPIDYLKDVLNNEKPRYSAERLKRTFDWSPIIYSMRSFYELVCEKKIPNQDETRGMASQMCNKAVEQEEIARNFKKELDRIFSVAEDPDLNVLKDRVQKAVLYFYKDIQNNLLLPLSDHLDELKNASKVKQYLARAQEIHESLFDILLKLEHVYYGNIELTEGLTFPKLVVPEKEIEPKKEKKEAKEKKPKAEKGESQRLSLTLYEEGKTIDEITLERNLSRTTIEGHIVSFIVTGEVTIDQIMTEEKSQKLESLLKEMNMASASYPTKELKEKLPAEYSYFDIKAVLSHLKRINK